MKYLILLLILPMMGACTTLRDIAVEKIPCVLPDDLKGKEAMQEHQGGGDLNRALDLWTQDRADGARIAKKHNDTVDFVERNCK